LPPVPAINWGVIGDGVQTSGSDSATSADNKNNNNGAAAVQAGDRAINGSGKGPVAVFFCSERLGQTTGIGTLAIRAKIKEGIKPLQDTIFESRSVLDAFKKAGINEFFKIPATKENVALAKKYQVTQDNTLVLCSPSGESIITLAGAQCNQTNVLKLLKSWPEVYEAWQQKNAK
jgi:hypothetical protein